MCRENEGDEVLYFIYERRTGLCVFCGSGEYAVELWRSFQDPLNQTEFVRYRGLKSHTFKMWGIKNPLRIVKTKWRGY